MPYYREEELINDKLEVVYYLKMILLLDIFRDEIYKDKKEILKFMVSFYILYIHSIPTYFYILFHILIILVIKFFNNFHIKEL